MFGIIRGEPENVDVVQWAWSNLIHLQISRIKL